VLVLPLLVVILLGIAQAIVWRYGTEAARTAGRLAVQDARLYGVTDPAGVATARARAVLAQLTHTVHDPTVTVTTTADLVTVTIHGHASGLVPGVQVPMTIDVSAARERIHP